MTTALVKLMVKCKACGRLVQVDLEHGQLYDHWADNARCELAGRTPFIINSREYQDFDTAIDLFAWSERGFLPLSSVELRIDYERGALSFWHSNGDFICAVETVIARRAISGEDRAMLDYFKSTINSLVQGYFLDTQ